MTILVEELLNTFDRLTESERLDLVLEILKRTVDLDFPPLSDDDLVLNRHLQNSNIRGKITS